MQDHGEKHRYLSYLKDDYLKRCQRTDFVIYGYCIMSNHVHENGKMGTELSNFSNHMRRAHGRFGMSYNRRHGRLGKVAHDRPRTKQIEDDEALMRCMFYSDCNPVRAGLIKHPGDIRWKGLSSCRYYTKGEKSEYSQMLTQPDWYLKLGKTSKQRQSRYSSMLDKYLEECGLKQDPRISRGYFIGGELWIGEKILQLRAQLKRLRSGPAG